MPHVGICLASPSGFEVAGMVLPSASGNE